MPSVTGALVDDRLDLESPAGLALADLPFNAYYVAGVDLGVPAAIVSYPSSFVVRGTGWPAVPGTAWSEVRGARWPAVPGSGWPSIRGRALPPIRRP